ncbi:MAG TPA: hypothetical protein VNF74_01385 [Terriglobales bacterium]|nr:hypothetical protein [Terriglobales bacterium]
MLKRWTLGFLLIACFALAGWASPINMIYGFDLNATTTNGVVYTGVLDFNPVTQTFGSWEFHRESGGQSDLNNGVVFQNPDTHLGPILSFADGTASLFGTGLDGSFIFEFNQSAGTGVDGFGNPNVQTSMILGVSALPFTYSDPAGQILGLSNYEQGPNLQTTAADFSDNLFGTLTLAPGQNIPAPVTTPEPAAWSLFGSGLALLGVCGWWAERRRGAVGVT